MSNNYRPIDCGVYDRLEVLAIQGKVCSVEFTTDTGTQETRERSIADVFAKDGEEFIRLSDELLIRLDHLVRIDGEQIGGSCDLR